MTPEQQLQKLEQEYQERRTALEKQVSEQPESVPSEHETMSRVLENTIQQQVPQFQASSHAPRTVSDDMLPPEAATKIQEWVNISFAKGIWQGIKEAQKSGDMSLIDAFHGVLSSQLYQTLVDRKKLPPLS